MAFFIVAFIFGIFLYSVVGFIRCFSPFLSEFLNSDCRNITSAVQNNVPIPGEHDLSDVCDSWKYESFLRAHRANLYIFFP